MGQFPERALYVQVGCVAAGNAYVVGDTTSSEATFPVTVGPDLTYNGGTFGAAFVAKIGDQPPRPPILPVNSVVNGASFRAATEAGHRRRADPSRARFPAGQRERPGTAR